MEDNLPDTQKHFDSDNIVSNPVTKNHNPRKFYLALGTVISILALFFAIFMFANSRKKGSVNISDSNTESEQNISVSSPTPTPMMFQELTVPFMRNEKFDSNLEGLEIYSKHDSYISFKASYNSDGFKVYAQLTKPNIDIPEGGFGAIIFIHGYIPPSNYQTFSNYYNYVDYLAQNGLVVLKIDLRGHGDSEGVAGGAYYSSDYVRDVLFAYSALQKLDFVNPSKIGLWGHSMAGNISLRAWAAKPDIPAVVIWAGAVYSYSDWQKYQIKDNSYQAPNFTDERIKRREALFKAHGQFNEKSKFWAQVAPINYIGDLRGSLQIHHAVDDDVVSIGYSRDLVRELDKEGIENELFEYSSGGHNIQGVSFSLAMQRTVDFFRGQFY